jgi:hypothetical protein
VLFRSYGCKYRQRFRRRVRRKRYQQAITSDRESSGVDPDIFRRLRLMRKTGKLIYQFKITLKHIKPPVWRRIQVPENYSFWDLHVAIQDAMGWTDSHLHGFILKNPMTGFQEEIGSPGEVPFHDKSSLPTEKKISRYFNADNPKALYVYDFGDDWEHEVLLEKILPLIKDIEYPVCIGGKRSCPPDDCGGPLGYMDLLEIIADPGHEEYEEMIEWLGEEFNPGHFNSKEVRFEDPESRWEHAYGGGDEDEIDEGVFGAAADIPPEVRTQARALSRDYIHGLWERAKKNELEGLSIEDQRMVKILQDHDEEFFNDFEFSDVTYDHEHDPEEDEVNPFLHIFIHSIVETQLSEKDPIEAFQFYNAVRNKKCSHHDTIHIIGAILTPFMFRVMNERAPFDRDGYRSLLKKYKTRNPDKLFEMLLSGSESDSDL